MGASVDRLVYVIEIDEKISIFYDLQPRGSGYGNDGESYVFFIFEQISEISPRNWTQDRAGPLLVASLQFVLGTVS